MNKLSAVANHIGITVPDIEQAATFFKDVFHAEEVGSVTDFGADDDWMKDNMDVHPRTIIKKIKMMKLPDGFSIELFHYEAPGQNKNYPQNQDFGGHHIALDVEDIEQATAYLKEKGVRVLGDIKLNDPSLSNITGVFKGLKWIYFLTPWGSSMELIERKN